MKLLIGLGNPGGKYAQTRHNVGFMALDRLGQTLAIAFKEELCFSLVVRGTAECGDVMLAKPQTFMNLSGTAVAALMKKFSVKLEDIVVMHDDIDVPLGKVREKVGGGSAGHNGISSIAEKLGTPEFRRIRIGVGRPPEWMEAADYVLSPFEENELSVMARAIDDACKRALVFG